MKVINSSDLKQEESTSKLFQGKVYVQRLIDDKIAKGIRVTMVSFSPGAKNVFHTHTSEQVLYGVDGKGIVATEKEEHVMMPGTIVFIPPGERHWHGAAKDKSFSHLSITTPGETSF